MEANMGRATAGASQIYCVIRPDDRKEESAAWLEFKKYFSFLFIMIGFPQFLIYIISLVFRKKLSKRQ